MEKDPKSTETVAANAEEAARPSRRQGLGLKSSDLVNSIRPSRQRDRAAKPRDSEKTPHPKIRAIVLARPRRQLPQGV